MLNPIEEEIERLDRFQDEDISTEHTFQRGLLVALNEINHRLAEASTELARIVFHLEEEGVKNDRQSGISGVTRSHRIGHPK